MPKYQYAGLDTAGKSVEGTIEGADPSEAFETLRARGVAVLDISDSGSNLSRPSIPWYARELSIGGDGYRLADQTVAAELLGVLSDLDIPVTELLKIMSDSAPTPGMRRHFKRMEAEVADGASIADAFERSGSGFSPLFGPILRVGEISNALPQVMASLAQMFRRADEARARVGSALIYPTILIMAAVVLVGILAFYLAPALEPIFRAVDQPLPATLALLLSINALFSGGGLLIGALVLLACFVLMVLSGAGRRVWPMIARRLPIIGPILDDGCALRHVSALETLLRAGLPLDEALETTGEIEPDTPPSIAFLAAGDSLRRGDRGLTGLGAASLPAPVHDLFAIGEEANRLPDALRTLTQLIENRLERRVARAMQLVTPLLTLFIGLVMGFLVYTVIGALLDVNSVAFQ